MNFGNPELLAPAGEIDSVYAALYAGADAVYLGAPQFSARAYAVNLTIEDIVSVIRYAHVFNKKIYLTLNILLKNKELNDAIEMLKPLYSTGLDGIIVQDMGLICLLNKYFPLLEIHASTQMAVMSVGAIRILKDMGIKRVVPARELSIDELKALKNEGLEIEAFIHGAMCYSYSGKCLFSSIAGGRSGNRGRCAGTCRKKYDLYINGKKVNSDKELYPISMRDMCTVDNISELIEAGIDSFKIEGRMKSPEYSAGVSSIYKSAINDFLFDKTNIGKGISTLAEKTNYYKKELSNLYIRSLTSTGFLHKHNGRNMITLSSPSYKGISDIQKKEIDDKFLNKYFKLPVDIYLDAHVGCPLTITAVSGDYSASLEGDICQKALNKSTDEASFRKQLNKLGNTYFEINGMYLNIDEDVFVKVSSINSLRRSVIEALFDDICRNKYKSFEYKDIDLSEYLVDKNGNTDVMISYKFTVSSLKQLDVLLKYNINNIILDWSIFNDIDLFLSYSDKIIDLNIYLRLPSVIRQNKFDYILNKTKQILDTFSFKGIYISSLDGLYIAKQYMDKESIFAEDGFYVNNNVSADFVLNEINSYTISYELNNKEIEHLSNINNREMVIYGYIPLMYTANCLLKTFGKCNINNNDSIIIKDEEKREYRVICNHELCFNTIYNNVPLSLFSKMDSFVTKTLASVFRIDFTYENEKETENIIKMYSGFIFDNSSNKNDYNDINYTLGHMNRGVQ